MLADRRPAHVHGLPRLTGGAVGYFGYDLVRFMERLPDTATRTLDVPDMALLFTDNLVVFDHVRHQLIVIANMRVEDDLRAAFADAIARIDAIVADLRLAVHRRRRRPPVAASDDSWQSNLTQDEFEANVRRAKEYIAAGDIFQVVLSQRLQPRTPKPTRSPSTARCAC